MEERASTKARRPETGGHVFKEVWVTDLERWKAEKVGAGAF